MRQIVQISFVIPLLLIGMQVFSQVPSLKSGPKGNLVIFNSDVPTGKVVSAYKVERAYANGLWQIVAEVRFPASFEDFKNKVQRSKHLFPAQPIPSNQLLQGAYNAIASRPWPDSLKKVRLIWPLKMAAGMLFYDTLAKPNEACTYRITPIKTDQSLASSLITDTVSYPHIPVFDTIKYSRSILNRKAITVFWYSAGHNPAPLFMGYKFKDMAPHAAPGKTAKYTINDTTYFTFTDSVMDFGRGNDVQYFISPYDVLGNVGNSSQVAAIVRDNFFKADLLKEGAVFLPKESGVRVVWHHSDPFTVKSFAIYRSESPSQSFSYVGEAAGGDTSYLDRGIWPDRTYTYSVEAIAKAGNRRKTGSYHTVSIPSLNLGGSLASPSVVRCVSGRAANWILIGDLDPNAEAIRVFKGTDSNLVSMPLAYSVDGQRYMLVPDTTSMGMAGLNYALRAENQTKGISGLSNLFSPEPPSASSLIISTAMWEGRIIILWNEIISVCKTKGWYSVSERGENGEFVEISNHLTEPVFAGLWPPERKTGTYKIRCFDGSGKEIGATAIVNIE